MKRRKESVEGGGGEIDEIYFTWYVICAMIIALSVGLIMVKVIDPDGAAIGDFR